MTVEKNKKHKQNNSCGETEEKKNLKNNQLLLQIQQKEKHTNTLKK